MNAIHIYMDEPTDVKLFKDYPTSYKYNLIYTNLSNL